jgi:ribosome biogenesis GTPase
VSQREVKLWQHVAEDKRLRQEGKLPKHRDAPQSASVRHNDWTNTYLADPDAFDDLALPDHERVMPKGEIERRRKTTPPSPLGSPAPSASRASSGPDQSQGRVIEVSSGLCRVQIATRTLLCTLRSTLHTPHSGFTNPVAAGDEVLVAHNGHDTGQVEAVLPRRSALARPDVFYPHLQQVIVANVDQLLVVASWREPAFWPELADRYLIAAGRHGLTPILCINKADLAEDEAELAAVRRAYESAGQRLLLTSAATGRGLDELRDLLAGRTTALAGLSGVGKSSLLAAVEPGLNLRIGAVNARKHEGRHTTTQVSLHPLTAGGFVVDTPGIRELGLSGLDGVELLRFYPEFAAAAAACPFTDCTHTREPGCAVKLAVRRGQISAMRYDSYRKIRREL